MDNKAVFLDRDGTIAKDVHYCRSADDFELLPAVPEAVKLLNENGFRVVVITNQSGIARGYFTEKTLAQIHQKMKDELAKSGAHVDAIYHCPHHPDDGCDCRKPGTALFIEAANELDINLGLSYVVGDTKMDMDAGKALGCKTILVTTGPEGGNDVVEPPDYSANSLLKAAQWVVEEVKSVSKSPQSSQSITSVIEPAHNEEKGTPAVKNSIIIPAFNEEEGLRIVLTGIFSIIDDTFEVIVVDDSSTDRTREVAQEFPCRLICRDGNRGKGRALRTGIANAQGENVIWIDADATYPTEVIPQMVAGLATHDVVVCSRAGGREHIPMINKLGNAILSTLIQRIYGFKPSDPCTGAWAVKKRCLDMMELTSAGFEIEPEVAIKSARMGLRTMEIPLDYGPRVGESKLSGMKAGYTDLKKILGCLILYNPTLLFALPGFLLLVTGVALIGWFLAKPLSEASKPQEFIIMVAAVLTTLVGLQIVIFGIASQLYATAHKFATPDRLTRFFLSKRGGRLLVVGGIVGLCTGLGLILGAVPLHIPHGTARFVDLYEQTKLSIPALVAGLIGVEMLLSAIFLSIFRPKEL